MKTRLISLFILLLIVCSLQAQYVLQSIFQNEKCIETNSGFHGDAVSENLFLKKSLKMQDVSPLVLYLKCTQKSTTLTPK
jgi:Zn-dependent membrane protease YugP